MAYDSFKIVSEVARKFEIKVFDNPFVQEEKIEIPEYYIESGLRIGLLVNS